MPAIYRPIRKSKSLRFESLEPRQTLDVAITAVLAGGVLTVSGTNDDDKITISRIGNTISVDQAHTSFSAKQVRQIEIELGDGNDSVRINTPARSLKWFDEATTINSGDGSDTFTGLQGEKLFIGGDDSVLSFTKSGKISINGTAPDWFNRNVSDTSLRTMVRAELVDNVLNREDMLDLFAEVTADDVVGKQNFDSLKAIVGNKSFYTGVDYVQALSGYVVNGCVANAQYQGDTFLGESNVGQHGRPIATAGQQMVSRNRSSESCRPAV